MKRLVDGKPRERSVDSILSFDSMIPHTGSLGRKWMDTRERGLAFSLSISDTAMDIDLHHSDVCMS